MGGDPFQSANDGIWNRWRRWQDRPFWLVAVLVGHIRDGDIITLWRLVLVLTLAHNGRLVFAHFFQLAGGLGTDSVRRFVDIVVRFWLDDRLAEQNLGGGFAGWTWCVSGQANSDESAKGDSLWSNNKSNVAMSERCPFLCDARCTEFR